MFPCPLSSLPPIQDAFRALPLPSHPPLFLLSFLSCSSVSCLSYVVLCFLSFPFSLLFFSFLSLFRFPFVFPLFQREEKNKTQNKETKQAKENKGIEQKETSETSEKKRNHWLDKRNTFPLLRTKIAYPERYSVYYLSAFQVDKNNCLQVPGLVVPGLAHACPILSNRYDP